MAKTDKEEILEYLATCPDGAQVITIANSVRKTTAIIAAILSQLYAEGSLSRPEMGVYAITDSGRARIGVPLVAPAVAGASNKAKASASSLPEEDPTDPMRESPSPDKSTLPPVLPSELDKFMQIGRTIGIKEDFNKIISESIFIGDAHDLSWVWKQLNSVFLRPDVTKRWFNLWSTIINQAVPPEIAKQASPPNSAEAQKAQEASPSKWTLVGDEILPDPEGEYTFSQARQMLLTKAITKVNPAMSGDKVSDIINAITPLLSGGQSPEASTNDKVLTMLLEHTLASKSNGENKPMGVTDIIQLITALDALKKTPESPKDGEKRRTAFEELSDSIELMSKMKGLFAPAASSNNGSGLMPYPVAGADGKVIGAIPLDQLFIIQDHNRKVAHEDDEFASKQDTSKTVRQFLGSLANAAQKFGERQ